MGEPLLIKIPRHVEACEGWLINAFWTKPNSFVELVELVAKLPGLLAGPTTDRISGVMAALKDQKPPRDA